MSTERAMQMQQYSEEIKLIRPFMYKWEQKWSDGNFSFVFVGQILCICKKGWPRHILATKTLIFFGGLLYVYTALASSLSTSSSLGTFQDTLLNMSHPF